MVVIKLPGTTMKLFGRSTKTPSEVMKSLKDALLQIDEKGKERKRWNEEAGKAFAALKVILFGTDAQDPDTQQCIQVVHELVRSGMIDLIIHNLAIYEFETRKDAVMSLCSSLRRQVGNRYPVAEYLADRPQLVDFLIKNYRSPELSFAVGSILRECIKNQHLTEILLHSKEFYNFFSYIDDKCFDISSDSFATFKELMTRQKPIVANFLYKNYVKFFEKYDHLLKSDNYVTKRQSIRLLGEILIDRHNFTVMVQYVSDVEHLKMIMNLLLNRSRAIQLEAFHVFKVFVANPRKQKLVLEVLARNKHRLINFLEELQEKGEKTSQFDDERTYLIKQLQELPEKDQLIPDLSFSKTSSPKFKNELPATA